MGIQTAVTNSPFPCRDGTTPLEITEKPWVPGGVWTSLGEIAPTIVNQDTKHGGVSTQWDHLSP